METGTEAYKDVIAGSTIFFLSNLRQRIRERIVHASEEAEKANYRYNRINYTVQIFINAVSLIGQVMLVFVALLAAVMGSAASGAVLSVGNLAGSFFNGAGSFVQAFMTINSARSLWKSLKMTDRKADPNRTLRSFIPFRSKMFPLPMEKKCFNRSELYIQCRKQICHYW